MAAGRIVIPGLMPAEDHNGNRIPGALLYFYENGTTALKSVFTTAALDVQLPNPVVANDVGVFPAIWADNVEVYSIAATEADNTPIPGVNYDGVTSSKDATLASADLAEAAKISAEAARDQTVAINEKFGDVDEAITAAQAAQEGAETAEAGAEASEAAALAAQMAAEAAQAAAEQARDEAQDIAGFDVSKIVRVDTAQSFNDAEKVQARANIGAQALLALVDRQKVARPSIAAGALTLDCAAASVFEVSWDANITSLTLSNLAAGTDAQTLSLILVAAGGATFAPGAAFKNIGDTPIFNTTTNARNFLTLTTTSAGTRVDYAFAGASAP
ncbi:hypothetical protein LJR164_001639 [Phenylobacterium sp. LjRoot164]|uniref:hypothetical protein n=1 Tax=unclassified Phenylobacterium TaxID=2640670 RepID=UPI003ECD67D3